MRHTPSWRTYININDDMFNLDKKIKVYIFFGIKIFDVFVPRKRSHLLDAVGTPITERPPHRSVRADFPHTAPHSGLLPLGFTPSVIQSLCLQTDDSSSASFANAYSPQLLATATCSKN